MITPRLSATAPLRRALTPRATISLPFSYSAATLFPLSHALPSAPLTPCRSAATTQHITTSDAASLLAQQRLRRPVSPHLEIYDKVQTFLGGSIWMRFTGAGLSGVLYSFSAAYVAAPLLGWHIESAALAAAFAQWPAWVRGAVKMGLVWPVVFHFMNALRFFAWDLTLGYKKSQVVLGEKILWGTSVLAALGMVAFL